MIDADETLFLVRTRGFPDMARLLATTLATTGVKVAIVADEQDGPVDCAPFPKIPLCLDALAGLGLTPLQRQWRWLFGDMCYYLALDAMPGISRYALVESDVFIPPAAVHELVETLRARPEHAIAAQFEKNAKRRRYSLPLEHLGLDPQAGCIFPLTWVSPQVIAAMQALRLEQLQRYPDARLNDEGVLAGAVEKHGFTHARLEDVVPEQVGKDTFDTNPPHLFESVSAWADERRLFHPVVPFETVLARIDSGEKNYHPRRLRTVLRTAPKPMRRLLKQRLQARSQPRTPASPSEPGD